ncbi:hypothetical protein ASA1KI_36100 [Opitutales bacterium ASA1]|uniref:glycosyltransferase n=1 Tax=Congregicoccus parvus TaxID=3081749 RepID=UPI002B30484A|nr:hypothetical protein ASA1KI_36100 [Opitutales bacterium ASA1]
MNSAPTVAVLCAMYARDSVYLAEKAIRTILSQDYPREAIRVYLHVDGPLTRSHEYFLETHADWFHKILRSERNVGLPAGLNRLLDATEGEAFFVRMDVDDMVLPDRFARQIGFMLENRDVDLCGCNSYEIDDHDRVIFARNYPETHAEIVARLPRCNPMLHPTFCIRGDTWRRLPIHYRDLYLNEDLGFVFDVVAAGWKLHNIQERLFLWRTGESFHRRRNHRRALVELLAYVGGIHTLWGVDPRLLWPLVRYVFRLLPRTFAKPIYRAAVRNHVLG